ncbi:xanthine dehydrogenase-like isoform X2 [Periplaneta americana]|uniref:xanthine dehydrogenase-like isoform X2 n=1 Tax=Periplaneta americana TaxID=6978 RepID=UPI0037E80F78
MGDLKSSGSVVEFTINGKKYTADTTIPPNTSLNTFIREIANLRGTKSMCHEGGCGACIVTVRSIHPFKKEEITYAVNSCLISVFSCHGWAITTVEGIGNKKKGYHSVQARLAQFNGTQCGYCTPGMVMNMYSLLEGNEVKMKDVENSFGGNICRCTGYRSILDAFKSLAVDATSELQRKVEDIEDLYKIKICPKSGKTCSGKCDDEDDIEIIPREETSPVHVGLSGAHWYRVNKVSEIFDIFDEVGDVPYRLVAGNTGQGVYRITEQPQVYIDVGGIAELKSISTHPNLILGGNVSLTEAMNLFYKLSEENPDYKYTKVLADHIDLIANVPVRNTGTIAGNLAMKHQHNEFPSDMYLMLETVGATLNIANKGKILKNITMMAFLDMDIKHKVIHSINLPKLDENYHVRTFKIMPRAQNAHAYVNAGFLFKLKMSENGKVSSKPTIVFGGINPEFIHASNTESYVNGKHLFDRKVLRTALKMLDTELHPDHVLPDATPEYRKGLAEALFYKFVLGLSPPNLPETFTSGGKDLQRPLSSGKQDFDTDKSVWPLNKPIPKLEAMTQCSGEAQYVNDIPTMPGELYAAFTLTTVGQGYISKTDPSDALAMPGVVAFLSAKDIPGKNNFIPVGLLGMVEEEELFCSGNIKYAGQPVGVVVASTQSLAHQAALQVKVEYSGIQKPIVHMREAIGSGDKSRIKEDGEMVPEKPQGTATHTIEGSFDLGSQYHYTMETQSCVCIPIEDGLEVHPASQWMDLVQIAISQALNIPENNINVSVRRLGGGYGSKISRNMPAAVACALAAYVLNRPVRFVMNLETNMAALGKRYDAAVDYVVGVDDDGKIQYMKTNLYENAGCSWNEPVTWLTLQHMKSCYDTGTWAVKGFGVRTDIPGNTYCRAPSSTEGIGITENIMEHIAKALNKDPIEVRLNNMKDDEPTMKNLIQDLIATAEYESRKQSVEEFNKAQRWRKRGIALVPMIYEFPIWGYYAAMVSIYAQDGTVAVTHGGIEMGQGLNTKVAQVVAHILDIPLEYVSVKPSNNLTSPNGMVTGGSITSEACSYAAMLCCKELLKRMEPAKKDLDNPTWQQWTQAAYKNNIDLCATHLFTTKDDVKPYDIYGVTIAEVEVDLLTGQHQILRVDILEDAGQSLSPEVDIGQVEGAFIMGMGYWTMEVIAFHPDTGELLTNRTWTYKPPGAKDIPIDFRVYMRKNAPNPFGVLRSKATGEPPLCMSCVIFFALKNALNAARIDAGKEDEWFAMNAPATAENIFLSSLTNIDLFSL